MDFSVDKSIEILENTPDVLIRLTKGLSSEWIMNNEGPDTWSVFDVVGHLIHGEKTDWMTRIEIILSDNENKKFEIFDRFAQYQTSKGKSLNQLLDEFKLNRELNLKKLRDFELTAADYDKTGIHPKFGEVNLSQLIATWAVHDLNHISQIARVMAKQYKEQTGPWIEYLKILRS